MKYLLNVILVIIGLNLQASTYFVETEAELISAISTVTAGDTITMKNGIWNNIHISFSGTGNVTNPILLRAETRGQVFLEGNSKLSISGNYLIVDGLYFRNGSINNNDKSVIEFRTTSVNHAHYCRITNCSIIDFNPPSSTTEYKYVSIYGSHNRFDHCHIEGKNNEGASLVIWTAGLENHHLIDFNYFGPRPILGQNGGETIRCGDSNNSLSDSFNTFENNLFDQCNGEIEIISNKTGKSIFRYNTFRDCIGLLTLRHGNGSEVYNNYFFGDYTTPGQGGVRVIGENHKIYNNYFQDLNNGSSDLRGAIVLMNCEQNPALNGYAPVINVLVSNNTIVNCKTSLIIGAGDNNDRIIPPDQCAIVNNILYSTRGDNKLIDYQDTPTLLTYAANIAFGDPLGISSQAGILEIDPLLEVPTNDELWRPSPASPSISGANSTYINGLFTIDIDGQTRTEPYDIGADEVDLSASINYPPLVITDVGPIEQNASLPIVLSNFQAKEEGYFNTLKWTTYAEKEFDYFEIQKKESHSIGFQKAGQVTSENTNTSTRKYTFIDQQPFDYSFYRLKMVDLDGHSEYSKIISLKRDYDIKLNLSISPNPVKGGNFEVIIEWGRNKEHASYFLGIYDINGQEITKKHFSNTTIQDTIHFVDMNSITGLYIVKLYKGTILLASKKIVISN